MRTELARARLLYGEWLRRERRRLEARGQLRAAHDSLTTIGMNAFAERARRELAATGETVRKRTVDTPQELTAQELHIARMAAEGLTNPRHVPTVSAPSSLAWGAGMGSAERWVDRLIQASGVVRVEAWSVSRQWCGRAGRCKAGAGAAYLLDSAGRIRGDL